MACVLDRADEERMAVGRGLGNGRRADIAARSRDGSR